MSKNGSKDIKEIINYIISKCSDIEIYSNVIKDFYTKGIDEPSACLESLGIPHKKKEELQSNFKKNNEKLINFIKSLIKEYEKNDKEKELDLYKVLSCIYGAFVGDAVGAFCEFHKPSEKNRNKIFHDNPVFGQLKGQATDDSEMSMSFAYAIMENPEKENLDINYLYFYYGAWAKSKPIDIGHTTKDSFKNFDFIKFHPKKKNFEIANNEFFQKNYKSLSNGFLMRKSTFIAWFYYRFYYDVKSSFNDINDNKNLLQLYIKIKGLAYIDDRCTHPNLETCVVSSFYCIMALGAISGLRANNIIDKLYYLCKDNYFKTASEEEKKVSNFIIQCIDRFKSTKFDKKNFIKEGNEDCITKHIGWYIHSFKLTLYYLINYEMINEKKRFQTILEEICNFGGDTDTNCCIVGGVIGPLDGFCHFGEYFTKVLDVIPRNRYLFSISLMVPYINYLKNSKRKNNSQEEHYFLKTILSMLYDEIEMDYFGYN